MKNRLVGRWERVKGLWYLGVGAVMTAATASLGKQRFVDAFTSEGFANAPVPQMAILLFLATIALIFLWIKATSGEYQMLRDHFSEFVPSLPKSSHFIVIMLAIIFGLLAYFSDTLVVYSAIFACHSLFTIWGIWVRDSRIRVVLQTARSKASPKDERRKSWIAIETYYFRRPQLPLTVGVLFFSFVALTMGLSAELLDKQPITTWLLSAGYVVMVLNIAASEVIYRVWRRKRDRDLQEEYD